MADLVVVLAACEGRMRAGELLACGLLLAGGSREKVNSLESVSSLDVSPLSSLHADAARFALVGLSPLCGPNLVRQTDTNARNPAVHEIQPEARRHRSHTGSGAHSGVSPLKRNAKNGNVRVRGGGIFSASLRVQIAHICILQVKVRSV